jgi:regulatory protein RepA
MTSTSKFDSVPVVASAVVPKVPVIVDAADFLASNIEQPAELIAGILHKGSKLACGGSSKSFKTWVLLDVAVSVATGTAWLGFPTAQGKVLFVNFKIQPHALQQRINAVARAKGVEMKRGIIKLWNLRGHAADFRQLIPQVIQCCRAENYALIVLDPIYKLYGGTDENAAGDVAALLNALERISGIINKKPRHAHDTTSMVTIVRMVFEALLGPSAFCMVNSM